MSIHPLLSFSHFTSNKTFLIDERIKQAYSYKDFYNRILGLRNPRCFKEESIAICLENIFEYLALLFALESLGKTVIVLSYQLSEAERTKILLALSVKRYIMSKEDLHHQLERSKISGTPNLKSGKIVIVTTGSTGTPKAVVHTCKTLLASVKRLESESRYTWLLTYDLASFAGLQVVLHSLTSGAKLVVTNDPASAINAQEITHISGTPSFWRNVLCQLNNKKKLGVKQVTIGGEIISQDLLTSLKCTFPNAAITQVYASTEMGACFYVKDGKAGFPEKILTESSGVQAKIKNGELWIKSSRSMKKYQGKKNPIGRTGWYATGDMVSKYRHRIYIVGRKSDIINVGGFKVFPGEVEEVIQAIKGVLQVRVYSVPNNLMGQLVATDIEIEKSVLKKDIRREIIRQCQRKLAKAKWPRIINIVRHSFVKRGKVIRRGIHEEN